MTIIEEARAFVEPRYNEPWRKYHTMKHVDYMFDKAKEFGIGLSTEQRLAILFHDVVYLPGYEGNEARSVQLFTQWANSLHIDPSLIGQVRLMIAATVHHMAYDDEIGVVCDLDLLVLASDDYDAYTNNIRREFAFLSNVEFNKGRVKFIKDFLFRESIYHSHFRHLNDAARVNLTREGINIKMDREEDNKP